MDAEYFETLIADLRTDDSPLNILIVARHGIETMDGVTMPTAQQLGELLDAAIAMIRPEAAGPDQTATPRTLRA